MGEENKEDEGRGYGLAEVTIVVCVVLLVLVLTSIVPILIGLTFGVRWGVISGVIILSYLARAAVLEFKKEKKLKDEENQPNVKSYKWLVDMHKELWGYYGIQDDSGKDILKKEDVDRLLEWISTEVGMDKSCMLLARHHDVIGNLFNTLEESKEYFGKVDEELGLDVLGVLEDIYEGFMKVKNDHEEMEELGNKALKESLKNRVKSEKEFINQKK